MKKLYHSACKEEKLAASRETNSKLESNNNPEAQKKLQEKVEKCQQEVQKVGPVPSSSSDVCVVGSSDSVFLPSLIMCSMFLEQTQVNQTSVCLNNGILYDSMN